MPVMVCVFPAFVFQCFSLFPCLCPAVTLLTLPTLICFLLCLLHVSYFLSLVSHHIWYLVLSLVSDHCCVYPSKCGFPPCSQSSCILLRRFYKFCSHNSPLLVHLTSFLHLWIFACALGQSCLTTSQGHALNVCHSQS